VPVFCELENEQGKVENEKRKDLHEKLDETGCDTGIQHSLHLIVLAIGEIRQSPACIRQHIILFGCSKEVLEGGQSNLDILKRRFRLASVK